MENTLTFRGKEYPFRIFHVEVTGHDYEATYLIAEEKLLDAINEELESDEARELDSEAHYIDEKVYHYVENEVFSLSAKEICEKHLDIPMKLIEEIY